MCLNTTKTVSLETYETVSRVGYLTAKVKGKMYMIP